MPNRILKDSICTSPNIDALSRESEVFFYRLLVQCDDFGRMESDLSNLLSRCYPLRLSSISQESVQGWMAELRQADLVTIRVLGGIEYIQLCKNGLWQNISRRPPTSEWIALRSTVFERDGYTCQYCGQYGGHLQCDHVIPVSRGGSNEPSNLTTSCVTCNQAKHNKTPEEWKR